MQRHFALPAIRTQSALLAKTHQRTRVLLTVMIWELRYCMTRRTNWLLLGEYVFFVLFYLLMKPQTDIHVFSHETYRGVEVDSLSNLGLIISGWFWLLLIGSFQLFIVTDLIAHDLIERTHELMMATPIPSWAYIWGRYLAGLCIGLLMSLALLVSVYLVGFAMHTGLLVQHIPGYQEVGYPAPNMGVLLSIWMVFFLPTIILLTAIGFVTGTLLPKYSNITKILLCLGWPAYMVFGINVFALSSVTQNWALTTNTAQDMLVKQAQALYHTNVNGGMSLLQRVHLVRTIEQRVPDMLPWLLPHALYMCIGLLCVFYMAHFFRRFAGISAGQLPSATTCR